MVSESVYGLWDVAIAFGSTGALLWTAFATAGKCLNRLQFHRRHQQRMGRQQQSEPRGRRPSMADIARLSSVETANRLSTEAMAMMMAGPKNGGGGDGACPALGSRPSGCGGGGSKLSAEQQLTA